MVFTRRWRIAALASAVCGTALFGVIPSMARTYLQPILTVTPGIAPDPSIVLSGDTHIRVATFLFLARRESLVVSTLTLQNCIATKDVDGDCADTGETLGDDAAAATITLSYINSDGDIETASGTLTDGSVTFTDLDFAVDNGEETMLTAYIDAATIDAETVTSGMQLQLNMNGKTGTLLASGVRSGLEVTEANVKKNVMAQTMTLRNTEPTLDVTGASPLDSTSIGDTDVLRFTVTPNAEDTGMTLRGVTFGLQTSDKRNNDWNTCRQLGSTGTHFTLTNGDTGEEVEAIVAAYDTAGDACSSKPRNTVGLIAFTFTDWVSIHDTTTFSLSIDTSGANAKARDMIRATLPDQEKLDRLDADLSSLVWSDGASRKLADGSGVDDLPLTGKKITLQ